MKTKLYSDICWDAKMPTKEEMKALAEATATMLSELSDKNNKIIAVIPRKNGNTVFLIRK